MKQFILRISLLIIILVSFISFLYLISDFYLNYRKQYFLKLKSNIDIVFAGDSHVECALNDSLIPNTINIAHSGEAYMYTYVKLKTLLKYNPQIKTIFLSFSPYKLDKKMEDLWLFNDEFVIEKNKSLNYLLTWQERKLIFENNPKIYLEGIRDYTISNFTAIIKSYLLKKLINFGGYKFLVRDELQENISKNDTARHNHFEKGIYQLKYLVLISELCHQKSVKLILIDTPKYKTFKTDKNITLYWDSVSKITRFDSVLDVSRMFYPDSYYGDVTHLNYKGAEVFSKYLKEKIYSH